MSAAVKYYSFAEPSGYGRAATAYLQALLDAGVDVLWVPMRWRGSRYEPCRRPADLDTGDASFSRDDRLRGLVNRPMQYDTVLAHTVPEYWPMLLERDKLNIGCTVWETDVIPPRWQRLLELPDRIFVPSGFTRNVFKNAGVSTPIRVVPHIAEVPAPPEAGEREAFRRRLGVPDGDFVFYTINAWTPRKAVWRTIQAYLLAFSERDPVTLVVKTSARGPRRPDSLRETDTSVLVGELAANLADAPRVCLVDSVLGDREMEALHAIGDCYVSLTCGEGWGLGAFEAAARGRPVIMTGWGGQCDFLTDEHALRVDYRLVPVVDARGGGSYRADQRWACADIDQAIERLRWVRANPVAAAARGAALAAYVNRVFNPTEVGRRLVAALHD